ncbi:LuxR C-terminal-related transcriptional regulator [Amphritea sp. HPY]|uniref:response regulator transcription factor n=1 Tax=Amphritea sp. HPY TaxID=3421652 RepID=UPI003D7F06D8
MRLKKILLANSNPLVREGVKSILATRDYSIVFFEAGTEDEFIKATRNSSEFDLIIVQSSLLSVGRNGLISSFLYKTSDPIMVLCEELTPDLDLKIRFFDVIGVVKSTDAVAEIEQRIFDLLLRKNGSHCSAESYRAKTDYYPASERPQKELRKGYQFKSPRLDYLTDKQGVVLSYLKEGLMNKEIAFEMGIQECTVKRHVSDILKKLQAKNRTQLVVKLAV